MSRCSIRVESRTTPGDPTGFVGQERECGNYIDKVASVAYEEKVLITVHIGGDQIPCARLMAYLNFTIAMEKLTPRMLRDFDYKLLLEHTSPTGKLS
jgi:hypothetical protein